LQGQALRIGSRTNMAVGMNFGLQDEAPLVEQRQVNRVLIRQAKKREIVVGEVHRVG
jgi:hypothetical protein